MSKNQVSSYKRLKAISHRVAIPLMSGTQKPKRLMRRYI